MTVNKRVNVPADRAPFTAVAFTSNDEINHRISFFEVPHATIDSERSRHARVQHIAFAYGTLDDLLGTYVRLARLGMAPMWAADQWFQTAIYYEDPDKNIIELNVDNFTNLWAVTEGLKELPSQLHVFIDPEKLIAARKAGASPWDVHVRAFAGEFVPAKPYDLGRSYRVASQSSDTRERAGCPANRLGRNRLANKMIGSKPYAKLKIREVNGARMAYVDEGEGDAIVFQHGQPASSYVWRNVMPHLEGLGRLVAGDLIGMGASDKLADTGPASYSLAEHAKYLFALWDALDLGDRIVLVLDDWGAALGFWWARLNPERVKAIVHMEAVAVPMSFSDLPEGARPFFQALRAPAGEEMVLEQNIFIEQVLKRATIRDLTQEIEHYRRPFLEPGEGRRPTLSFRATCPSTANRRTRSDDRRVGELDGAEPRSSEALHPRRARHAHARTRARGGASMAKPDRGHR